MRHTDKMRIQNDHKKMRAHKKPASIQLDCVAGEKKRRACVRIQLAERFISEIGVDDHFA